jgi:hypothetical protein
VNATDSLLDRLPSPPIIHERMSLLSREMALLRRLLRLSQATRDNGARDEQRRMEGGDAR